MVRQLLGCVLILSALISIGCCGPMGCGPGCSSGVSCNDCDGAGFQNQMMGGPLDGLRHFKRSLVCGGGCGETYVGEWISTPPDCADPCCGNDWVGGASKCRPFCWQPGSLIGRGLLRGLYGKRFCSGAESSVPCGCGDCGCDSCGGFVDEVYADTGYYEGGMITTGGSGCSSCGGGNCAGCGAGNIASQRGSTRMVQARPPVDPVTRSAARRADPDVQRIRR